MPLVHIMHSIDAPGVGRTLSRCVHDALVTSFAIPGDDYFHVVTPRTSGAELFGPASFLGVEHTQTLVFVQVTCAPGRTIEQKKALFAQVTRSLQATGHVRAEDVIVNLVETPRENWSFGNGLAQFAG